MVLVLRTEGCIPSLHISPHQKNCLRRGDVCNMALPVKTTILCYSFTGGQSARLGAYYMCINIMTSDARRADMLVPWEKFFVRQNCFSGSLCTACTWYILDFHRELK